MDREELDKLDRLGVEAIANLAKNPPAQWMDVPTPEDLTRAVLAAVLPAYDAMRDAEWELETWPLVRVDGWWVRRMAQDELFRRVGKEGGS